MSEGIKALARKIQSHGRGPDTVLAHIMPEEAAMLKRMGGSGTVNPKTGLLEFVNPGDIAGGGYGSGNVGGGSSISSGGGASANPGDIAGGGFGSGNVGGGGGGTSSYTGGGGGGGGGGSLAAGRAADLASVPGYTATRGGRTPTTSAGNPLNTPAGVGRGVLTAANPSISSTSANFPTTGGSVTRSNPSTFGMPTIVENAWNSVTSAVSNMANAASRNLSAAKITELPGAVGNLGNAQLGTPVTTPNSFTPVNYANAIGELNFLSPKSYEMPTPQLPSLADPTTGPTSTTNAYNFNPNIEGTPLDAQRQLQQIGNVSNAETFARIGPAPKTVAFPDVQNAADLYGTTGLGPSGFIGPKPVTSISLAQTAGGSGNYMSRAPSGVPVSPAQVAGGSGTYMTQLPVDTRVPDAQVAGGSGDYIAQVLNAYAASDQPTFGSILRDYYNSAAGGISSLFGGSTATPDAQVAGGSGNYMSQAPAAEVAPPPTMVAPATLGTGLESLMGTTPAGVYTFPQEVPAMAFKQTTPSVNIGGQNFPSSYRVNVPSFLSTVRDTNFGTSLFNDPALYQKVVDTLPEKGIQFTPGSIDPNTGLPRTGSAVYTGAGLPPDASPDQIAAAQQAYTDFVNTYKSSLTPRSVTSGTFTSGTGTGPAFDVSGFGAGQAPSIGSLGLFSGSTPVNEQNVGAVVTTSLEDTFSMLAGNRPVMTTPNTAQTTPSLIDYSQAQMNRPAMVNGVPVYAQPTSFSGPKGGTVPMSDAARWAGGGVFTNIEQLNGLPSGFLGKMYGIESGFGKDLKSVSSTAAGPFGFIDSTARKYGLLGDGVDLRNDIVQSAAAAGALAADNAKVLSNSLGRSPTAGELYLAHQQGAGGAVQLLKNPSEPAIDVLGRLYKSPEMALQALVHNGGNISMTAGEFAKMWTSKMDRAPVTPSGGYSKQAAGSYVPTVSVPATRSAAPAQNVTATQVASNPDLTGSFLDTAFDTLASSSTGGGGGSVYQGVPTPSAVGSRGTRSTAAVQPAPVTIPIPPKAGKPTTGMVLTAQPYLPSDLVETPSPVYS